MLGEVQYGGRVTDDFDKRLLNTFARVWFSQEMFKDTFKFYQGYNIPRCTQIADFRSHIDEMPLSDTPEVRGYEAIWRPCSAAILVVEPFPKTFLFVLIAIVFTNGRLSELFQI